MTGAEAGSIRTRLLAGPRLRVLAICGTGQLRRIESGTFRTMRRHSSSPTEFLPALFPSNMFPSVFPSGSDPAGVHLDRVLLDGVRLARVLLHGGPLPGRPVRKLYVRSVVEAATSSFGDDARLLAGQFLWTIERVERHSMPPIRWWHFPNCPGARGSPLSGTSCRPPLGEMTVETAHEKVRRRLS